MASVFLLKTSKMLKELVIDNDKIKDSGNTGIKKKLVNL
jgi:hypothetical protein